MTPLRTIEAHLTAELERLRAGGESCPECGGDGQASVVVDAAGTYEIWHCDPCNGSGKSPAITAAESTLKLCQDERKRVERLLEWLQAHKGFDASVAKNDWRSGVGMAARDALAEYNAPVKEETDAG